MKHTASGFTAAFLASMLIILALAAETHAKPVRGTSAARRATATTSSKTAAKPPTAAKTGRGTPQAKSADTPTTISDLIRQADSKTRGTARQTALVVNISGQIRERAENLVFLTRETGGLKQILDTMRLAREDKNVRHVVLRFSAAQLGLAMVQELRQAVAELRANGKKTIAVLEDDSQASYMAASACDEVVMPPSGDLMITGVKADAYFLRGLLDKVGARAQVVHIGEYKSFGEMFTEDDFTTPARENMTEIVDDIFDQLVNTIADSRRIGKEQARDIVNSGPLGAKEAKDLGLIDRLAYADEVFEHLRKAGAAIAPDDEYTKSTSDKGEDINLFSLLSMMGRTPSSQARTSRYPQIAVVYAIGPIMLGASGDGLLANQQEIYSEDFIKVLDEIQKDKQVRAAILRIDSPGGSAFASDLIWKKIDELKRVKPVVASMGDTAASGGYYIAMGANRIIAQEGTLTGSIGVVGGKLNFGGTFGKLGVRKTTISRGDYATLFSETDDFSDSERDRIHKLMRETYEEFVSKAARGRRIDQEKLEKSARGRVWTGARAKTAGLVDDCGGLIVAIREAKKLIGLRPDDKVSLVAYPKEVRILELLQKAFADGITARAPARSDLAASLLPGPVAGVVKFATAAARMWERERVLAIMPFVPVIR